MCVLCTLTAWYSLKMWWTRATSSLLKLLITSFLSYAVKNFAPLLPGLSLELGAALVREFYRIQVWNTSHYSITLNIKFLEGIWKALKYNPKLLCDIINATCYKCHPGLLNCHLSSADIYYHMFMTINQANNPSPPLPHTHARTQNKLPYTPFHPSEIVCADHGTQEDSTL